MTLKEKNKMIKKNAIGISNPFFYFGSFLLYMALIGFISVGWAMASDKVCIVPTGTGVVKCPTLSGPEELTPGETGTYTFQNGETLTITMPSDACGTITFKTKTCSIVVRSTNGQWVYLGNECRKPGPMTSVVCGRRYERIDGRYKQVQDYTYNYFLGTCLYTEPPCGNQKCSCTPATDIFDECISVESTGLIDNYDMQAYPCFWQSTAKWIEVSPRPGPMYDYCVNTLGALGVTSMRCFQSYVLQLFEWQCN
jgi:hypothetical protein